MTADEARAALRACMDHVRRCGPDLALDTMLDEGVDPELALAAARAVPSVHDARFRDLTAHLAEARAGMPLRRLEQLVDRCQARGAGLPYDEWVEALRAAPLEEREALALHQAARWVDRFGNYGSCADRRSSILALAAQYLEGA